MKHITKLLATLLVTAGFAYALKILGFSCWPCCSFTAWVLVIACIWQTDDKQEGKAKFAELEKAYAYRLYIDACHAMKRKPMTYKVWIDKSKEIG